MRPNHLHRLYKIVLSCLILLVGYGVRIPPPGVVSEPTPTVVDPAATRTEVFPFRAVDVTYDYSCGVRTDGAVACWGSGEYGALAAPEGAFSQVSTGERHGCGVRADGTVACWGENRFGQRDVPSGTFRQVSAGAFHTCGVKLDGRVTCWGEDADGKLDAPGGTFSQVSASSVHTCGLTTGGTVACWGKNDAGRLDAPDGTFSEVSAGENHTCGIKTDGTAACWGDDDQSRLSAPGGTFKQVSAGTYHSCGLREDTTVTCWGADSNGRLAPPGGTFSQISAGPFHGCGVKTGGTLACWGSKYHGEATPPVPPTLSQQPRSTSAVTGEPFTLSVTAGGGGLAYRWRKDGTKVSGATSNSYTVASASVGDSGSYDVVVTNVAGRTISVAATVVVTPPSDAPAPADTRTPPTGSAPFRRQQRKNASYPRAGEGRDSASRVGTAVAA